MNRLLPVLKWNYTNGWISVLKFLWIHNLLEGCYGVMTLTCVLPTMVPTDEGIFMSNKYAYLGFGNCGLPVEAVSAKLSFTSDYNQDTRVRLSHTGPRDKRVQLPEDWTVMHEYLPSETSVLLANRLTYTIKLAPTLDTLKLVCFQSAFGE